MKKFTALFIFTLLCITTYAQETEVQEITKIDILTFMETAEKEGKITKDPIVVVNENQVLDLNRMNDDQQFYGHLSIRNKGSKSLEALYGEKAKNGAIIIKTMPKGFAGEGRTSEYNDILFFIGDKQVAEEEIKKIHPDDIAAIQVVKNKEEMVKYTLQERDGIIVITLKE